MHDSPLWGRHSNPVGSSLSANRKGGAEGSGERTGQKEPEAFQAADKFHSKRPQCSSALSLQKEKQSRAAGKELATRHTD